MINIGVLVSGGGSNLQAIMDGCDSGPIDGRVVVVISNNSSAYALERARGRGIPAYHMSSLTHPEPLELDLAIAGVLKEHGANIVCFAGYMKKRGHGFLKAFPNRVLNIHPALLPTHGGKGLFGKNVHREVIQAGEHWSGATVHLVNEDYDSGPIVARVRVPVMPDDTPDELAARVLEKEHMIFPEVLSRISHGSIDMDAFGPGNVAPLELTFK